MCATSLASSSASFAVDLSPIVVLSQVFVPVVFDPVVFEPVVSAGFFMESSASASDGSASAATSASMVFIVWFSLWLGSKAAERDATPRPCEQACDSHALRTEPDSTDARLCHAGRFAHGIDNVIRIREPVPRLLGDLAIVDPHRELARAPDLELCFHVQ